MSHRGLAVTSSWIALSVLLVAPLAAQTPRGMPRGPETLMHPQYDRGQPVSPVFEGWYRNPDGTYTLSFGYFNRNAEEGLEIPLGPNNFIEPTQFDGMQPTSFPTGRGGGFVGRGWGVFTVVVPATFSSDERVVWTLTSKGRTYSVPGKIGLPEYQLAPVDHPAGVGSKPPRVRFEPNGPEGVGPGGVVARQTLRASVGVPLNVSVWAADNFELGRREPVPVNLTWFKHQGPPEGNVTFGDEAPARPAGAGPGGPGGGGPGGFGGFGAGSGLRAPAEGGDVTTTATFSAPGEYVLRVEAGNFAARDSSSPDQCCWTNGYVRVVVTP